MTNTSLFETYANLPTTTKSLREEISNYKNEVNSLYGLLEKTEEVMEVIDDCEQYDILNEQAKNLEEEIGWRESEMEELGDQVKIVRELNSNRNHLKNFWGRLLTAEEIEVVAIADTAAIEEGVSLEELGASNWIPTLEEKGILKEEVVYVRDSFYTGNLGEYSQWVEMFGHRLSEPKIKRLWDDRHSSSGVVLCHSPHIEHFIDSDTLWA